MDHSRLDEVKAQRTVPKMRFTQAVRSVKHYCQAGKFDKDRSDQLRLNWKATMRQHKALQDITTELLARNPEGSSAAQEAVTYFEQIDDEFNVTLDLYTEVAKHMGWPEPSHTLTSTMLEDSEIGRTAHWVREHCSTGTDGAHDDRCDISESDKIGPRRVSADHLEESESRKIEVRPEVPGRQICPAVDTDPYHLQECMAVPDASSLRPIAEERNRSSSDQELTRQNIQRASDLRLRSYAKFRRIGEQAVSGVQTGDSLSEIKDNLDHLIACYRLVETNTENLIGLLPHEKRFDEEKYLEDLYQEYKTYSRTLRRHLDEIQHHHQPETHWQGPMQSPPVMTNAPRKAGIPLQKLEPPKFNGQARDYAKFKANFKIFVENQYDEDSSLYVLRSSIGKLESCLNGVTTLTKAWDVLDDRFGNETAVSKSILEQLSKWKPIDSQQFNADPYKFITFVEFLQNAKLDLERINMVRAMDHNIVITQILSKIPAELTRNFTRDRLRKGLSAEGDLQSVMEFLECECRVSRMMNCTRSLSLGKDQTLSGGQLSSRNHQAKRGVSAIYESSTDNSIRKQHRQERTGDVETSSPAPGGGRKLDPNFRKKCPLHPGATSHQLWKCRSFLKLSERNRAEIVDRHKLCRKCTGSHDTSNCKFSGFCTIPGCKELHSAAVHGCFIAERTRTAEKHSGKAATAASSVPTICPILEGYAKNKAGQLEPVVILSDSGSNLTIVDAHRVKNYGGKRVSKFKTEDWSDFAGEVHRHRTAYWDVPVFTRSGKLIQVRAQSSPYVARSEYPETDIRDILKSFNCRDTDYKRPAGSTYLIIGTDNADYQHSDINFKEGAKLATSPFGFVVYGKHPSLQIGTPKTGQVRKVSKVSKMENISDFFATEAMGVECSPKCGSCRCGKCAPGSGLLSIKEEQELRLIKEGIDFDIQGKKVVAKYPWIKDPNLLPNNFSAAERRLKQTEKALLKDPALAQSYHAQIADMLARGVARKLTPQEENQWNGPIHYIPHHGVPKPDSASTPLRIVFDSSSTYQGHRLNDYWAKGPNYVANLLGVLLRFREEQVAIYGDISKMYHTIGVSELEQHTHRFLWRDLDQARRPETYVCTTVSFGDGPAGCIAISALHGIAELCKEKFPEAVKTIINQSYVDDIMDSVGNQQAAEQRIEEIEQVLGSVGFSVKNWTVGRNNDKHLEINGPKKVERVLGMLWQPTTDNFKYQLRLNFSSKKKKVRTKPDISEASFDHEFPNMLSRREVLSQVNGIYDPFGFLAPFTIRLKLALKRLWRTEKGEKIDWDAPLEPEDTATWKQLFRESYQLQNVTICRCLRSADSVGDPSLIVFSDSSQYAFGACAYFRWKLRSGGFESRLVGAKSKGWPMEPGDHLTIVRGELQGAVLAKRLAEFIRTETRYNIADEIFLIDSTIVQAMINKDSHRFQVFVANRVAEIRKYSSPSQWYHIASKYNVADKITRGCSPNELMSDTEWQKGPEFLKEDFNLWPVTQNVEPHCIPEQRLKDGRVTICNFLKTTVSDNPSSQLSEAPQLDRLFKLTRTYNWNKLLNVTARIIEFVRLVSHKIRPASAEEHPLSSVFVPTAEMRRNAQTAWIRCVQDQMDINGSKYKSLAPVRDAEGIWRVGGRIPLSKQYHPIILPADHIISYIVMWEAHLPGHHGTETTLAKCRRNFWVVRGQKVAKAVRLSCVLCRYLDKPCVKLQMPPLPVERTTRANAFRHVAIDLFGPFVTKAEVRGTRNRPIDAKKVWGLIVNCMVTRAVDISVLEGYDTASFLAGLRSFCNRRGQPETCFADRGTQIVAADGAIQSLWDSVDKTELRRYGTQRNIKFSFTKAGSPWQNGVSEALVKGSKRAIEAIMLSSAPKLRILQLQRLFESIANILNERPIGKHPNQPEDGPFLCPNDLIMGRASNTVTSGPWPDVKGKAGMFTKEIAVIERLADEWWRKWRTLYFPSLVPRRKWHIDNREVKIGDLVLIKDINLVRGEWKRGEVMEVFRSEKDGKVRSARLRYKIVRQDEPFMTYKGTPDRTETRDVKSLVVLLPAEERYKKTSEEVDST